jgi:class 3 adenylate cyclase
MAHWRHFPWIRDKRPKPAVHRTILVVDVEGFCDRRRTDRDRVALRAGMYRALNRAFTRSGLSWNRCYHEDRGDGVLVLIPPEVPKSLLAVPLPAALAIALAEHNDRAAGTARIRLRAAVHAGEVLFDEHGATGSALNHVFRLLETGQLRSALGGSPGVLALIASDWFYGAVIRHEPAAGAYRPVRAVVKETDARAWIRLPDAPTRVLALRCPAVEPGWRS